MFPCVLEVPISLRSCQHLSLSSECSRPVGVQCVSLVVTCSSLLPGGVKRYFMGFLPYVHFPSCSRWLWPGGVSHRAHFIVGIYVAPWLWGKDRAGAMKVGLQTAHPPRASGLPGPSLASSLLWAYMGGSKTQ